MKQEITVKSALQPPPTKTEVIEALVQLAFEKWSASKKDILAKKKALEDKLKTSALKLARKNSFAETTFHIRSYGSSPYVTVCHDIMDVALYADLATLHALEKSDVPWDKNKERVVIQNAMNGVKAGRVEALLTNEDTRKKLVALGTQIGVM